jgi:hypothetical protein
LVDLSLAIEMREEGRGKYNGDNPLNMHNGLNQVGLCVGNIPNIDGGFLSSCNKPTIRGEIAMVNTVLIGMAIVYLEFSYNHSRTGVSNCNSSPIA